MKDYPQHRRPARACPPPGAARLFRICRWRLLQRADAARQPRRPRGDQAAPARAGRRLRAQPRHHRPRAEDVGAAHPRADRHVRHAARRRRNPRARRPPTRPAFPFTLSTMSICSIEDVAEATGKPFWFQLYVIHDRGFSKDILERAISGEMQRAGAHRRSAGARPAPQGHPQRHDGAAGNPPIRTSSTSPPSRPGPGASSTASARPSATSPAT